MSVPWHGLQNIGAFRYTCGFCGYVVSSDKGYSSATKPPERKIYICSDCGLPTLVFRSKVTYCPGELPGYSVKDVEPAEVTGLYEEARRCASVGAYTSAVMACRKLLMNIAVTNGAERNKTFKEYVEYLCTKGFLPPGGKAWASAIKDRGNDANHEIPSMQEADAELLIDFSAGLLRHIYEFPAKLKADLDSAGQTN